MKLRKIRENKRMTQAELAVQVGVKPNTISQWESGSRKPDIDTVLHLATILNCTVDELLRDADDSNNCSA